MRTSFHTALYARPRGRAQVCKLLLFNTTRSARAHNAAAVQHNAHSLRAPKHRSHYHYGRVSRLHHRAAHAPSRIKSCASVRAPAGAFGKKRTSFASVRTGAPARLERNVRTRQCYLQTTRLHLNFIQLGSVRVLHTLTYSCATPKRPGPAWSHETYEDWPSTLRGTWCRSS